MRPTNLKGPIPYLKSSNFLRTWSEQQGEICEIEGVRLSFDRPAPPLKHGPIQAVPARVVNEVAVRQKKQEDPYLNAFNAALKMAETASAFSSWLKTPAPAKSAPQAEASPPLPVKKIPPFDIQDVPKAMRKLAMPKSAILQERWFAGQANYSRSAQDLKDEINQNSTHYGPAMVDAMTIKMEWVLSFGRARKAFDELLREQLKMPGALKALKDNLTPYRNRQDIHAWTVANADFLEFHQKFHFQHIAVNASWGARIGQFLDRSLNAGGVPDDLTGALGSFNFYTAVRHAWFEEAGRVAFVDEVSIYVRDPYEFSDEQYLGHWSPSHVAVVPARHMTTWLDYPVNSLHDKDSVLYPVTNKDYRDWRQQHGQGGDFMIYTDRQTEKLDSPIRVEL